MTTNTTTTITETYFKGDRVRLTGKSEKLYGGLFFEGFYLEGSRKGERLDVAESIVRLEEARR